MGNRSKLMILLFVILSLASIATRQQNVPDDEEVARKLSRMERRIEVQSADQDTRSKAPPSSWWLAKGIEASKNLARETWFVRRETRDDSPTIQFPFAPNSAGSFPQRKRPGPDEAVIGEFNDIGYLGAAACASCHQEKYEGFSATAHSRSSARAATLSVKGDFDAPSNTMRGRGSELKFTMHAKGDRLYQRVQFDGWNTDIPMDVVTGSGKTGQTFLYWLGDALFQDHVTYMASVQEWIPSPGFTNHAADYSRPIKAVCLECHVTYIHLKRPPNHYDRDSAIWGISCERCHGPGRDHVSHHQQHPNETKGRFITNPSEMSRERQLDICAQCHSGIPKLLREPFSYRPGEDLKIHHQDIDDDARVPGGIHTTNQLKRLKLSRCFQNTEMTCTSCHNPHLQPPVEINAATGSCLACHESEHCGLSGQLDDTLQSRCIDCHMPRTDNNDIMLQSSRGRFSMQMTDHYIRVDHAASDRMRQASLQ